MKIKEIECNDNCILFFNSFCLHTLKIYIIYPDHEYQSDEDDLHVKRRNTRKVCRYCHVLLRFSSFKIIYRQGNDNNVIITAYFPLIRSVYIHLRFTLYI